MPSTQKVFTEKCCRCGQPCSTVCWEIQRTTYTISDDNFVLLTDSGKYILCSSCDKALQRFLSRQNVDQENPIRPVRSC